MKIPKDDENSLQDYSITMMQLYKIAQKRESCQLHFTNQGSVELIHYSVLYI